MKNLIVIALCLALSSCMSYDVRFKNADGKTYFCKGDGWGLVGVPVAFANKDDCIARAEANGFKKQGE